MKILMILDHYFPPDIRVENEALSLLQNGHQVDILSFRFQKKDLQRELHKGIIIHRLLVSKKWVKKCRPLIGYSIDIYSKYWETKILNFLQTHKIDVLHVHDLYMASAAIKIKQKVNYPIVLDLHENFPAAIQSYNWTKGFLRQFIVRPKRWIKLEKKYLKKTDKLIVLSEGYKCNLCQRYSFLNSKDIIVYPNVPHIRDLESYSIDKTILPKDRKKILFYFGVVAERRGIYHCIEALKRLKKKYPNLTLLIIGPVDKSDKNRFLELINGDNIKKNIIYHPWKDISLLPSYILSSDVCLSPLIKNEQHESGIANKVFQYMLFGKPILASDCEPQKRLIEEVKCGVIFKSKDVKDLASKIEDLLDNPEKCEQYGKNGRNAVLSKYNWKNMSKNLLTIYPQNL